MKKIAYAMAGLGLLALGSTPAGAIAFTAGATITSGDKLITLDSCDVTATGTTAGVGSDCSGINFLADVFGGLDGFRMVGNFSATGSASNLDILLGYHVDVITNICPTCIITDAHLAMVGSANSPDDVTVDELLLAPGFKFDGALHADGGAPVDSVDPLPIATTHLDVSKDISIFGFGTTGKNNISVIHQNFSQNNRTFNTPEPLSLSIFGAGLLGLGALRRRKKS